MLRLCIYVCEQFQKNRVISKIAEHFKIKAYLYLNCPLTCDCLVKDRSATYKISNVSSWVNFNFQDKHQADFCYLYLTEEDMF